MDYAHKKKSKIILITDSELAPRAENSDVIFKIQYKSLSFFNSYVPTLAILNAILCGLVNKNKYIYRDRLNSTDQLMKKFDIIIYE